MARFRNKTNYKSYTYDIYGHNVFIELSTKTLGPLFKDTIIKCIIKGCKIGQIKYMFYLKSCNVK